MKLYGILDALVPNSFLSQSYEMIASAFFKLVYDYKLSPNYCHVVVFGTCETVNMSDAKLFCLYTVAYFHSIGWTIEICLVKVFEIELIDWRVIY